MNRVKEVKALPDYRLDIVFRNGERGILDCNTWRAAHVPAAGEVVYARGHETRD